MFCDFFIRSKNLEDVKDIIVNTILKEEIVRIYDSIDTVLKDNENQDGLDITFGAFTVFLRLLDEDDAKLKSNIYRIDLNCSIHFSIFHNEADWGHQIMKFIGCIMQRMSADCVFEDYGVPVIIRKSGQVTVDESRSTRLVSFPYKELNLSYTEGDIVLY